MKPDLWILSINANRARILRGLGYAPNPAPAELVMRSHSGALRDIMADKPGRSHSSMGDGRRSAMEYGADTLREDERQFLREVLSLLEAHRRSGDFKQLAIFAAPRTLGLLREEISDSLGATVVFESDRNLVGQTQAELEHAAMEELRAIREAKP